MKSIKMLLFVTLVGLTCQVQALTEKEKELFKIVSKPTKTISQQDINQFNQLFGPGGVPVNTQEQGRYIDGTQRGFGQTALIMASRMGHATLVRNLLKKGADPNIQSNLGADPHEKTFTALCIAVDENQKETVQILLDGHTISPYKWNTKVNIQCFKGNTALNLALLKCRGDIAKILLNYGADGSIKNDNGKSALDITQERGYSDFFQMILDQQKKLKEKFEAEIARFDDLRVDTELAQTYLGLRSFNAESFKAAQKLVGKVTEEYEKELKSYLTKKYG